MGTASLTAGGTGGVNLISTKRLYIMTDPPGTMQNLLLAKTCVEELALPSNVMYGTAIYQRGAVEFIRQKADVIEGWVGGLNGSVKEGAGQRRRVTFSLDEGKLHWKCTGNPKNHQIFCKHCVALALAIKSP